MKKKTLAITLSIFAFLLIGVVFYFATFNSVVQIKLESNNYKVEPIQRGIFNFAGYEGNYETPYLGNLRSQGGTDNIILNEDNDGEVSLYNTLSDGDTLKLASYITSQDSGTDNYIKTKIILPKGKLKINLNYDIYSYYSANTYANFKIGELNKNYKTPIVSGKEHYNKGSESLIYEIDKEKEIEISIYVGSDSNKFSSMGSLTASFEKYIEPVVLDETNIIPIVEEVTEQVENTDLSNLDQTQKEETINEIINQVEQNNNVILTDEQKQLIINTILENQKPNLLNYFLIGGIVIFLIVLILLIRKRK